MPTPLIPLSHLNAPAEPERKYRLMEIVLRAMRERRYSPRTEEAYTARIRRYILFSGRRHPLDLDVADVRGYVASFRRRTRACRERAGDFSASVRTPPSW